MRPFSFSNNPKQGLLCEWLANFELEASQRLLRPRKKLHFLIIRNPNPESRSDADRQICTFPVTFLCVSVCVVCFCAPSEKRPDFESIFVWSLIIRLTYKEGKTLFFSHPCFLGTRIGRTKTNRHLLPACLLWDGPSSWAGYLSLIAPKMIPEVVRVFILPDGFSARSIR